MLAWLYSIKAEPAASCFRSCFLFADNKAAIFNHNCKNGVLLGHIKDHCGLNPAENIDLSDEAGHVKQLHYNLEDYGTKFLEDREILVLLKVNSK